MSDELPPLDPVAPDMQHSFTTSPDAYNLIRRGDRKMKEMERQQAIQRGGEGINKKGNVIQRDEDQQNQLSNLFPVVETLCVNGAPGFLVAACFSPPQQL